MITGNYLLTNESKDVYKTTIIESKNPKYNYLFAKNVDGTDIGSRRQVMLESKKRTDIIKEEEDRLDKFFKQIPYVEDFDEFIDIKRFKQSSL